MVKESICQFVRNAFQEGQFDSDINKVLLVLIPKVTALKSFHQFKPISLCNFNFEIITKILTHRLKPFMDTLISEKPIKFYAWQDDHRYHSYCSRDYSFHLNSKREEGLFSFEN